MVLGGDGSDIDTRNRLCRVRLLIVDDQFGGGLILRLQEMGRVKPTAVQQTT